MSDNRVYERWKDFKSGPDSSGRFSSFRTSIRVKHRRKCRKVKKMVLEGCHTSLKESANELGIAYRIAQHIVVKTLCVRRVKPPLVSKTEILCQKTVAKNMISGVNESIFVKHIIATDDMWIYEFGMETSQQ